MWVHKPLNSSVNKLGFIINPIAGMGGAVGLKGTDGKEILEKALQLGAKPTAPVRAKIFLNELNPMKKKIQLFTGAGNMGAIEAIKCDYTPKVFGKAKKMTLPKDTKTVAIRMREKGVKLLVFCGGDGTARDLLDSVGKSVPLLGVPTGVKIHSAVFAVDPKAAARIVMRYFNEKLPLKETEVMDINENDFREGRVSAKLYGYVLTPYEPSLIQGSKIASILTDDELRNQAALAVYVIEEMKPEILYIVGPGTTTRTIGDLLGEKKTLLGVDIFSNRKITAKDVNEERILKEIAGKKKKIIVTPIGGQGFIFGRGNQQISPKVIRQVGKKNIVIIATKNKLKGLKKLRVDTGDPKLDEELRGFIKVITDYREEHIVKIE